MAAPLTPRPLFSTSHHISAYPSPTSTSTTFTSDIDSPDWPAMSPREVVNGSNPRKLKPKSPAPKKKTGKNNASGFVFVTGSTPDELRSKENMSKVRRTAMTSFLQHEKAGDTPRTNSVDSDQSQSGFGNQAPTTQPQDVKGPRESSSILERQISASSQTSTIQELDRHTPTDRSLMVQTGFSRSPIIVPIFVPIVEGRKDFPFDTFKMPPLASVGKQLDPFRTMYRSNDPRVRVEELKHHCSRIFGTRGLGIHWVPLCLKHRHTFLGTLFMASAHWDTIHNRKVESVETTALRQDIIHLVSASLTDPDTYAADQNIMAIHQLIVGEIIMGRSEPALTYHQTGIEKLIKGRGGLEKLGLSGHLASAVSWAHLAAKIINGAEPSPMFVHYSKANSTRKYVGEDTVAESPAYCPRGEFLTLRRSINCKEETLGLLENMRMMIEIFLQEPDRSRQSSSTLTRCYHTIIQYRSVEHFRNENVLTYREWRYEAIRITAIVLAEAIINGIPLSDVLHQADAQKRTLPIYIYSSASHSNESLVSPLDAPYRTPMTDNSTSPAYSSYGTSPTGQSNFYFAAHRSSNTSTNTSWSQQRPSFSSFNSSEQPLGLRSSRAASIGPDTLQDVRNALENSNLSYCWGDMAGVLLWIGLVMGAASGRDSDGLLKRYYSAMTMRTLILHCFDHREAMHATTLKMTEIVEQLGTYDRNQLVRKDSGTSTKRIKS